MRRQQRAATVLPRVLDRPADAPPPAAGERPGGAAPGEGNVGVRPLAWTVWLTGVIAIAVGAFHLGAWLTGDAVRWAAGTSITMKTNAALAFILSGCALLLLGTRAAIGWRRWGGVILSASVLLIGGATLVEHLLHLDLGLDQLLATELPGAVAAASPNRMGLPASVSFTLLALGMLTLAAGRLRALAAYVGIALCCINLVPAVGYVLGVDAFYGRPVAGIAWPTVATLLALSVGLALVVRDRGPLIALLRADAGGRFLRRALPWVLLVPLGLGYLRLRGERAGVYEAATGTGLLVIALVLFFSFFLWRGAAHLGEAVAAQGRAYQALRESDARAGAADARLRIHVESTPLAVVEWDAEYRVTRFSDRAEEMFGWGRDEVIGRRIDEIPWVAEEDWPSVRAVMRDMASGTRPTNVNVNRNVRKDGSIIYCEWYNSTISDDAGRLVSVLSLVHDVTEGKAAEARSESLARFPEENPHPVLRLDRDCVVLYANQAGREQLRTLGITVGAGAPAELAVLAREAHTSERRVQAELPCGDALFSLTFTPVADEVNVYGHDITARKAAEAALRESEQRYRTMGETLPYGVWLSNAEGGAEYASQSFLDLLEMTQDEMRGFGWTHRLPPEDVQPMKEKWLSCVRTGTPWDSEHRVLGPDGKYHHVLTRGLPVRDAGGRITCWVGINLDIDERKQVEEEIRRADRRKAEFLAMLSHELRNPLAPIRNSVHVLERAAPASAQATRAREVIRRQSDHLTRLVDDLLDMTRISSGKITLHPDRVDLREIVRKTTDDLLSLFQQSEIELRVEQVVGPVWVDADATRIAQVVANLLQNAVKFTPARGAVTIGISSSGGRAEIFVRDTGVGIEPGQVEGMFEPFAQADQNLARTQGGLGLGLSLVRGLVELHGGSVHAHSEGLGRGSEFVVSLPLAAAGAVRSPLASAPDAGSRRQILIIEDDVDAGQSLADILELAGHRVRVARDGRSGVALARELTPDVILCDIGLPDIDGYEVLRTLRSDEALRGTRIVALSGYAQAEDVQRAQAAGFDGYLPKPLPLERIDDLLAGPRRTRAAPKP